LCRYVGVITSTIWTDGSAVTRRQSEVHEPNPSRSAAFFASSSVASAITFISAVTEGPKKSGTFPNPMEWDLATCPAPTNPTV
jgi:hypothetical protein